MTQFIFVCRFLCFVGILFFYPGDGGKMAIRKATFYVRDLTSIYQGNLHISDDPMFDICRRDA